jgi:hypothetical protein
MILQNALGYKPLSICAGVSQSQPAAERQSVLTRTRAPMPARNTNALLCKVRCSPARTSARPGPPSSASLRRPC